MSGVGVQVAVVDEADDSAVGGFVPYFGAKRTLAPRIVEEIGTHAQYFEVFCGSCAVLLAKPAARMEYVNDLNGDLVNLIRVIADPRLGPKLYRECRRTLMCEALFREACERWKRRGRGHAPEEMDFRAACDYFYTSWVGRNGVVGTSSYNQGFAARYTSRGGHAGTRWVSAVDSIPAWRRRMRSVVTLNRDAFELLDKIEDETGTAIYADPPYLVKGAKYIHDFEGDEHQRLAASLSRFKMSRVVVSYYEHPDLERLYPPDRWTHIKCPVAKSMLNGNGRKGTGSGGGSNAVKAPEVLIVNGESYSHGAKGGLFA